MKPQTIILMGRAGSGKGTQGALLKEELLNRDNRNVFYLETGAKFRDFIKSPSYSSERSRAVINQGALMPSFLAVWNWGSSLLDNMTGEEHLIIDGTPRMKGEAIMFKEALEFYQRDPVIFIYLNVPATSAAQRLVLRGRHDDTPEGIDNRMKVFETEVAPVVEYFRADPKVKFIEIDGTPSIPEVSQLILSSLQPYFHD